MSQNHINGERLEVGNPDHINYIRELERLNVRNGVGEVTVEIEVSVEVTHRIKFVCPSCGTQNSFREDESDISYLDNGDSMRVDADNYLDGKDGETYKCTSCFEEVVVEDGSVFSYKEQEEEEVVYNNPNQLKLPFEFLGS